ncbi:hypothetical protein GCM10010987_26180 [Bradyrhizobium guangdongense]|uniref:Uncharacterized protein n=1 Tax=Bradyrhizobium guangdongense TaxID=1325090 RepID=A0A410V733_9BRAD|nr:hypothetical protein X265_18590 [Bradyrhizobium guangdongense]QOZ60506.1 hypothetical protein XH86_18600 [Bradyrhizobium guangdongense]GGI23797.1 hypothetical protein GCM10010987_26180 [Bradyrhizobium guangdongense]
MGDRETSAILGLKRELKAARGRARDLAVQNESWRAVAQTLRKLAGIDDSQFANVLKSESLTE